MNHKCEEKQPDGSWKTIIIVSSGFVASLWKDDRKATGERRTSPTTEKPTK